MDWLDGWPADRLYGVIRAIPVSRALARIENNPLSLEISCTCWGTHDVARLRRAERRALSWRKVLALGPSMLVA
jgi:hypothetical protein